MKLEQATPESYERVRSFYHSFIDEMRTAGNIITWMKDVYPSPEFLQASLQAGQLYLGRENGEIAAAMVLNSHANDGYAGAPWRVAAAEHEVLVIHALGVHPRFGGRGLGRLMTQAAIGIARERGMKALRLDVLEGNDPARRIYVACGFYPVSQVKMYYENTGWATFELFEYAL